MSEIPNLFGDIDRSAPAPVAVLKAQAHYLTRSSGGLLVGEVRSTLRGSTMEHLLLATAPALAQQLELLRVEHVAELPYPAVILPAPLRFDDLIERLGTAEVRDPAFDAGNTLLKQARQVAAGMNYSPHAGSTTRTKRVRVAEQLASYAEFEAALRAVLGSPKVRGVLNSLIAQSNAAQQAEDAQPSD